MKNITFSADEDLIESARQQARSERTTLNEVFREWLADYARRKQHMQRYDTVVNEVRGKVRIGRKLARDEMNER